LFLFSAAVSRRESGPGGRRGPAIQVIQVIQVIQAAQAERGKSRCNKSESA